MPKEPLRVLSLFAGIGGIDLGFERAGMVTVGQVEWDDYCVRVLEKHWPDVPRWRDVNTVTRDWLESLGPIDVIAGGFPCQNLSSANNDTRIGIAGAKSSLWFRMSEVVDLVRPYWVVVENVSSGWRMWVPSVRKDLEEAGYATFAVELSAYTVGAPHLRRRTFVVGCNADSDSEPVFALHEEVAGYQEPSRNGGVRSGYWLRNRIPGPVGVVDGVPNRMDRLRALGNAVVPQVAEVVGRMIVAAA